MSHLNVSGAASRVSESQTDFTIAAAVSAAFYQTKRDSVADTTQDGEDVASDEEEIEAKPPRRNKKLDSFLGMTDKEKSNYDNGSLSVKGPAT